MSFFFVFYHFWARNSLILLYKRAYRYFRINIYHTSILLLIGVRLGTRNTKKRRTGPIFVPFGLSWPPLGPFQKFLAHIFRLLEAPYGHLQAPKRP